MRFNRFGLSFQYPDNWSVDVSDAAGRHAAVSVHSPGGGFWSVSGHAAGGPPDELARAVVAQMQAEYRDLDAERATDEVRGHELAGYDLNFYCLDLTNTAQIRTVKTGDAVYLLLCQAEQSLSLLRWLLGSRKKCKVLQRLRLSWSWLPES